MHLCSPQAWGETGCPLCEQLEIISNHMNLGETVNLNFKLRVPIQKENFTVTEISCDSISGENWILTKTLHGGNARFGNKPILNEKAGLLRIFREVLNS